MEITILSVANDAQIVKHTQLYAADMTQNG
jgi:hypothetical protein